MVSGTFIRPEPAPKSTKPGISEANVASRPSSQNRYSPTALRTRPNATVRCAPTRAATGPLSPANTAMHSAIGTKARPALVGEKPSTPCRYSEVKK